MTWAIGLLGLLVGFMAGFKVNEMITAPLLDELEQHQRRAARAFLQAGSAGPSQ